MFKNKKDKNSKKIYITLLLSVVITGIITFSNIQLNKYKEMNRIDYPTFWELVNNNEVSKITIKNYSIKVDLKNGNKKYTTYPNTPNFKEDVLKHKIEVKHLNSKSYLDNIIYILVMASVLYFMYKFFAPKSMIQSLELNTDKTKQPTTFDDVAGIDEAKEQLFEVVEHLKNPKIAQEMSIRAPKGVLLVGPPGTGKTLLAKAVAGEAGVPFYSVTGSDFIQMFAGLGASRIRQIFNTARQHESCVVFIDEIDSIGKKRVSNGSSGNDEKDQTLNALLTEMDGFSNNSKIVIIAATNRVDVLDPALLRAGRFDRHIEVDYSDLEGREMILKVHSKNKPLDKNVDLKRLAKITSGFSGADLENLMNESGWNAIRNNRKVIIWEDIDHAFNKILVGSKKKRNILSNTEKLIVAYHEGGHALMTRLYAKIPIEKITISPTSKALGYVMRNEGDKTLKTKEELMNDICIALGGHMAETIIFGDNNVTNGASQDFKNITNIAYKMVFSYGMSDLGKISIDNQNEEVFVSEKIKEFGYKEMNNIIEDAQNKTKKFLLENIDNLNKLKDYLLEHESMDGEEFDKMFNIKYN